MYICVIMSESDVVMYITLYTKIYNILYERKIDSIYKYLFRKKYYRFFNLKKVLKLIEKYYANIRKVCRLTNMNIL